LRDAVRKRGAIVDERRVGLAAEADELVTAAVEAISMSAELEALQNAMNFADMTWIFGANKQVEVDEPRPCGRFEAKLDVGE
jgi:hypothetical protein